MLLCDDQMSAGDVQRGDAGERTDTDGVTPDTSDASCSSSAPFACAGSVQGACHLR